jgi:putative SOS response-associated peptidase YedK
LVELINYHIDNLLLLFSLCLISAKHLDESEDSSTRVLCSMRWSLVPHYFKGSLNEFKPILNNCRSETIDEKPTFKGPLKKGQRCVVLAEGFGRIFNY